MVAAETDAASASDVLDSSAKWRWQFQDTEKHQWNAEVLKETYVNPLLLKIHQKNTMNLVAIFLFLKGKSLATCCLMDDWG